VSTDAASARADPPLAAPGYTATSSEDGRFTLARTSPPRDWRVVLLVLAGATIVTPAAAGVLAGYGLAVSCGVPLAIVTAMAFAFLAPDVVDRPPRLRVRDRIVVGELGPLGQRMVRVDGRSWPAGEGTDVLATMRLVPVRNADAYWAYGLLLVLPDALVEIDFGRGKADARRIQVAMCEALQQSAIEPPCPDAEAEGEADPALVTIFVSIASTCVAVATFVVPAVLGTPMFVLAGGAAAAAVAWAGSLVIRAITKKGGYRLLREAREFAASQRAKG
jgi:hypothetical protein